MWKNVMRFCVILQLCFIIGNASRLDRRVTVEGCGKSYDRQPRIVGGAPVEEGFFPWMVTLHEKFDWKFEHVCGGSILNERWILTAAHCIDFPYEPEQYEIYVGLHHLSRKSAKRVKKHGISKLILHEDYKRTDHENDIALMKTEDLIDFGGSEGFVNGICLPRMNEREQNKKAVVAGWGHTQHEGDTSDELLTVTVPIISREDCNKAYDFNDTDGKDEVTENMLCAGSTGLDSCQADSGGPLVMWKYRRAHLFGIVSFGKGCGMEGYPGVYTKVSSYVDWIGNTILSNSL